jgi:hypothetical protein
MTLLACDAQRMGFHIPKPCYSTNPEYCVPKLGAYENVVLLFQQNAHNAFAICIFHGFQKMEQQYNMQVAASIELAQKNHELTMSLLQKTDDLQQAQEELIAVQRKTNAVLAESMSSLTEKVDQQLEGLGLQVEGESARIMKTVDELGRQVDKTVIIIKDGHSKIIEEVKSSGWGAECFWFAVEILEGWTGWSQACLAALVVGITSACIIVWCFELNKRQKLVVLGMIIVGSCGFSHRALVIHYQMELCISAAVCAVVVAVVVAVLCCWQSRYQKRQSPPADIYGRYYREEK